MEPVADQLPLSWTWVIAPSITLCLTLLLSLLARKGLSYLRRLGNQKAVWRERVDQILYLPLQIGIWGFGLAHLICLLSSHFGFEKGISYIGPFRGAFVVACLAWIALRWVKEAFLVLARQGSKFSISEGTAYALSKLSSFAICVLALLIIFPFFGLDVLPLFAFGGIGVAGLAFAAQDIIANFFGGMMLHFTRTFSIGDEIVIPSKEQFEGKVKEIGWYITVVEDRERRPVYFPNALFSKTHVINGSRRTHRRIQETIVVRYDDYPRLQNIVEGIKEKLKKHPAVDDGDSYSVTFNHFGEHGLEIFIYLLVTQSSYVAFLQIKEELLKLAAQVVEENGAQFCYPMMEVRLYQPKN